MEALRILVISYNFLPDYAGWLQQTLTMVKACNQELVSFTWASPLRKEQPKLAAGSSLALRPINTALWSMDRPGKIAFSVAVGGYLVRNRHSFDLVYCPQSYMPSDWIVLVAKGIRIPVVVRAAGSEFSSHHCGGRLRRQIVPRLVDAIVVLNQNLFSDLNSSTHCDKVHLIPNGVDTKRFTPPTMEQRTASRQEWRIADIEKVILFVGSIVPGKGVDTLVAAFASVLKAHPFSKLYLAGPLKSTGGRRGSDSDYVAGLQLIVRQHAMEQRVHFLDHVSNIEELMHAADLFVLPSLSEGMPNVLLEAMATGLPCLASDIPGIRDVIDKWKNGILFQPGNVEELTLHLNRLLGDPIERDCLGKQARTTIEQHFSSVTTAQHYQSLFLKIVSK